MIERGELPIQDYYNMRYIWGSLMNPGVIAVGILIDRLLPEEPMSTAELVRGWEPEVPASQETDITNFTAKSGEWWTPRWIVEACREVMGGIDLDPCSTPEANEIVRATQIYTREDNGLDHLWSGRVFINPPSRRGDPLARPMLWAKHMMWNYERTVLGQACLVVKSNLGYNWYEDLYRILCVCHLCRLPAFLLGGVPPSPNKKAKKGVSVFYVGDRHMRFWRVFKDHGRVIPPDATLNAWYEEHQYYV